MTADRLTTRVLTGSGTTANTYDAANRLTSVSAPGASGAEATSYTYDAAGRKLTATFANGGTEADTFSISTGELLSVVHRTSGSATIASHTYTYRADGRKTGETTADGSVVSYGYDAAGQLTSESKVSSTSATLYSLSYTYDGAGNRASKTAGGSTETYTYDNANKLTAAGVKSYTYDNAGNVQSVTNSTTGVTTNLAFDGASRMTGIDNGTTATVNASYVYNGLSQRVGRTDSTSTTYAYTRSSDAIDAPVLSDGQATYTQGNGLISEVRGSTSKFYKADDLGTTRALTGSTGTTTDTLSTDAFGNTVSSTGSTPSPFGFVGGAGYQTDSDTGLMLLGHRYYDPSTGRFLSRDPIQAGYNWYTYCNNDPVNAVDPEGLAENGGAVVNKSAQLQWCVGTVDATKAPASELPRPWQPGDPSIPGLRPPDVIVPNHGNPKPGWNDPNGMGYIMMPVNPGETLGGGTLDIDGGWDRGKNEWVGTGGALGIFASGVGEWDDIPARNGRTDRGGSTGPIPARPGAFFPSPKPPFSNPIPASPDSPKQRTDPRTKH